MNLNLKAINCVLVAKQKNSFTVKEDGKEKEQYWYQISITQGESLAETLKVSEDVYNYVCKNQCLYKPVILDIQCGTRRGNDGNVATDLRVVKIVLDDGKGVRYIGYETFLIV